MLHILGRALDRDHPLHIYIQGFGDTYGKGDGDCYSQTRCSFDGSIANFHRNIGILVDSLSQASCNLHEQVAQFIWCLMATTRWDFPKYFKCYFIVLKTGFWVFSWMSHCQQLPNILDRVKKSVPFVQGVDDQQIVISYKDLSLQTVINIDTSNSWHVSEAFKLEMLCLVDQTFTDKSIWG